jgi:hypothetical protein
MPAKKARSRKPRPKPAPPAGRNALIEIREVDSLREEIERLRAAAAPPRWNADPEDVGGRWPSWS